MRKCFGNKPLKDLTMERKRVEEFEESQPISFLASWILLLDHSINQCEIDSFLTTSQNTKQPSHKNRYGEKRFW